MNIDVYGSIANLTNAPDIAFQYQPDGTPWPSIAAAHNGVPTEYLAIGKIRFIDTGDGRGMIEHWYKGGIAQTNLVPRYENLESAASYVAELNAIKADTQALKEETEDFKDIATSQYQEKGDWNASTNIPALTADATVGQTNPAKPQRYTITVAGNLPFAIKGQASGSPIAKGYLVQHPNGQWFYDSAETPALTKATALEEKLPVINLFNLAVGADAFSLNAAGSKATGGNFGIGEAIAVNAGETIYFFNSNGSHGKVNFYNGPVNTSNYTTNHIASSQVIGAAADQFVVPAGALWMVPCYVTADKSTTQIRRVAPDGLFVPFGYSLTKNIKMTASDLLTDPSRRLVSDTERAAWNAKVDASSVLSQLSKNLFNPDPAVSTDGTYLNANGSTASSANFGLSGFIAVNVGDMITVWNTVRGARRVNMYTAASAGANVQAAFLDEGTNNTVTFVIPATITHVRISYYVLNKEKTQIEKSSSPTEWMPYYNRATSVNGKPIVVLGSDIIQEPTRRLVTDTERTTWNNKIGANSIVSIPSKNLLDLTKTTVGKVLNANGSEATNASYEISDFISVTAGDTISIYNTVRGARRVNMFTAASAAANVQANFLEEGTNDTVTFIIPATITHIRASIYVANREKTQIEKASAPTDPVPFDPVLVSIGGAKVPGASTGPQTSAIDANMVLPLKMFAIVGKEFNLYYDSFTLLPEYGPGQPNFLFDITCAKGIMGPRSFRLTPVSADVGSYPLTVKILDTNGNILQTATSTLYVVTAANPGSVKRILHFGDSTINEGTVTKTIQENLAAIGGNVPLFFGTHNAAPAPNEGRSSRTWAAFRGTNATVTKFTVTGVNPAVNTANIKNPIYYYGSTGNTIGLLERWKINPDGTGFIVGYDPAFVLPTVFPATLTATSQTVTDGFPATITITAAENISNYSIFKDSDGVGALNIAYYRTDVLKMAAGDKFDMVIMDLGINDISISSILTQAGVNAIVDDAKAVIAAFLADNSATRFILSMPKSRSSDMFVTTRAQSRFRINMHKLRKAYLAAFDNNATYPSVFISQSGYGIDRWYGYPHGNVTVASRILETFVGTTGSGDVHPNAQGYQQVGDALTGAVLYYLNG